MPSTQDPTRDSGGMFHSLRESLCVEGAWLVAE